MIQAPAGPGFLFQLRPQLGRSNCCASALQLGSAERSSHEAAADVRRRRRRRRVARVLLLSVRPDGDAAREAGAFVAQMIPAGADAQAVQLLFGVRHTAVLGA